MHVVQQFSVQGSKVQRSKVQRFKGSKVQRSRFTGCNQPLNLSYPKSAKKQTRKNACRQKK
jgi:hypothetical protein